MQFFPLEKSKSSSLQSSVFSLQQKSEVGSRRANFDQKGVSLIESLLVVVVVGAIVFLMANLPNAIGLIGKSRHLSLAREIAVKQIEDQRAISYINLVNDTLPISDSAITLLPNGSGVVKVEDCNISICTNSEDVKQITVTISWKESNKEGKVELKTFIGAGGINQ